MDRRHPDCPDVHMGSCPNCRRLYERDKRSAESSVAEDIPDATEAAERGSPLVGTDGDIPARSSRAPDVSKTDRLQAARKALTRAEISRRQREKDPEGYRKWNRERMKERRRAKSRKPDGSPEQS